MKVFGHGQAASVSKETYLISTKIGLLLFRSKQADRPEVAHFGGIFPVVDRIHMPGLRQHFLKGMAASSGKTLLPGMFQLRPKVKPSGERASLMNSLAAFGWGALLATAR